MSNMICKEMINSVHKEYLNAKKLIQTASTYSNLPCKTHAISCSQLFRINHSFRLHLEQDQILQVKLEQNRSYNLTANQNSVN